MKIVSKGIVKENELQSLSHGTRTPSLNHRHLQVYNWHSSDLRGSQTDLPCRLVSMRFKVEHKMGDFWSLRILGCIPCTPRRIFNRASAFAS